MPKLTLKAIEERVKKLGNRESYDREFLYDLLLAYGKPKSGITRLRTGSLNVAAEPEREVAQKNVVYFQEHPKGDDLLSAMEKLRKAAHVVRFTPRFVIVTDYDELIAVDTKTNENLVAPISQIHEHFTFFLPWAGMEKAQYTAEAHADVKAAEQMGKLFDELLKANPELISHDGGRHSLNVFFTRLLFCFFAEDTGIFADNQFTNAVASQTLDDGSDLNEFLNTLFAALDTPDPADKASYVRDFPYVNGRLFSANADYVVPDFTKHSRKLLIDMGKLIWRDINPDIFGSMFQAIVAPDQRSDLGQHYTSVPNILKTIDPLFMDDLREEFDKGYNSTTKLENLLDRIAAIKVFDPACGSGNFLVIAYKELRRLEHAILERLEDLTQSDTLFAQSRINIENFYGIEIDDFAVEVAILSLWIAKHQMNAEFKEKFNLEIPLIPLKETGHITAGNACRIDWNGVCPNDGEEEIYLIGNPPYGGSSMQSKEQKEDFGVVFGKEKFSKNLDYISLWFVKGSRYTEGTRAKLAFVSTNSVAQGDHVGLMFPFIMAMNIEICYAYTSFKWENNAKRNAGVTVVVIGLREVSTGRKYIFTDGTRIEVSNINPYLVDGPDVIVTRRSKPLNDDLPKMLFGSKPTDGGHLVLNELEAQELEGREPAAGSFIKKYISASDYINGVDRYCLWIPDDEADRAKSLYPLNQRLERVASFRRRSSAQSTVDFADFPYRFRQRAYKPTDSIIVPRHSSERREYIPMGYLGPDTVISDAAFAIYDAEPWLFALLTSRMHMAWTRAVGGKMKTDYRYSNTIVYNNFPVPELSDAVKEKLTQAAFRVLDVREYHCEKTLAQLYDPDLMPENLREAHKAVDDLVDSLYSKRGYETDEERLSDLFAMYESMVEAEEAAKPKKKTRAKKK